ncbi:MAG: 5'-nucleotidase C-terminal domain-containing protein [Bacteroides sp.]|nr:5'-nucleotidase C-terminal domain-containing protein [Bacteroides sp.]
MRTLKATALLCLVLTVSFGSENLSAKNAKPSKDTVNILAFNDFHGSFQQTADIPGAGRFVRTLNDLRAQLPNACVLACGDNYSGGYFPRLTGGHPLDEMFDLAHVEYSAIGNHAFDWGIDAMVERLHWGKTRYLAANIFDDSLTGVRPDWAVPYAIKRQTLKNGTPVRIAFIGLSTQETKTAASPEIVKDLDFANPVGVARKIMEQLKDSADLYILLTHIGTIMKDGEVCFTDLGVDGLTRIPGVDGILSGHSHKAVYGLRDGVPVIQGHNYGRKISRLQYEISRDKKGNLSHRFIGGELLEPQRETFAPMDASVERYLENPEYGFNEILTENLQELDPQQWEEGGQFSRLGALVTMAYEDCFRRETGNDSAIVLGVCNAGAIRTVLPQGKVTKLQAGNIIPFGGVLRACPMNGKTLRELLQYGIDCKAGWLQYHNMEVGIENGRISSMTYIKGNGRTPILDDTPCIVITENFVTSGGDGYNPVWFSARDAGFEAVPAADRNPTDVFIHYLQNLPQLDAREIAVPKVVK